MEIATTLVMAIDLTTYSLAKELRAKDRVKEFKVIRIRVPSITSTTNTKTDKDSI